MSPTSPPTKPEQSSASATGRAVTIKDPLKITTLDGYQLTASLHAPADAPRGAVYINPGAGINRRFYRHFARYLARSGYAVLTMDLRGLGDSLHGHVRDSKATVMDWVQLDAPAAIDWLAGRYPEVPTFAIGHSYGGITFGLIPNHHLLDGLVLLFASKAEVLSSHDRVRGALLFELLPPPSTPLFGYAPYGLTAKVQDLPAAATREMMQWAFHPRGIRGAFANRPDAFHYPRFEAPILALALEGDHILSVDSCRRLLREYYTGAPQEFVLLRPSDMSDPRRLTHLGYFSGVFAESHWSHVVAFLDKQRSR